MQQDGQGQGLTHGDQATNWFKKAAPDDVITGTIAGLKRVAELGTTDRDRFYQEVSSDPVIAKLFDDLKTLA
jgi:hypothetical protein